MSAVVVEEKLSAIFGLIPSRTFQDPNNVTIQVPKPSYYFGDGKECNALIKQKDGALYPLIFQTSTNETQIIKAQEVTTELELVLATRNTHVELFNNQRWATSYRNILMPLVDDIYKALTESGIIRWENQYTLEKLPNYSVSEAKNANAKTDIVDAVIFRATITIKGKGCINKTIFNN